MTESDDVFVGYAGDFPRGSLVRLEVEGIPVLIHRRREDDRLYAMGADCTHRQMDLSQGAVQGNVIICPRHGSQFDLATGAVVTGPATEPEPVYDVRVDGERVFVSRTPRQRS